MAENTEHLGFCLVDGRLWFSGLAAFRHGLVVFLISF
jgi:hypothetical protein